MMNDPIRQAKPEDAQAIAEIANAMIRDTLVTFASEEKSATEIADQIHSRGERFLVAEFADRVVGYATYDAFRGGSGYRYTKEHSIHLAQFAQGRGLGRLLLTGLEQVAQADRVKVLVAGISGANPGAIRFHEAMGYHQVGRLPGTGTKWGKSLDLVLMQKNISNS